MKVIDKPFTQTTKSKKSVLKHIKSELSIIFENVPVGILLVKNHRISRINIYGAQMLGYEPKDLRNRSTRILAFTDQDYDDIQKIAYPIIQDIGIYTGEHLLCRSDNSIFWASLTGHYIDQKNPNAGVLWLITDITLQKAHEEELERRVIERTSELEQINAALHHEIAYRKSIENSLKEKEEQLRTVINSTPDIICFKDSANRWLECNDAMKSLFGFSSESSWKLKSDIELSQEGKDQHRSLHMLFHYADQEIWENKVISQSEELISTNTGQIRVFDVIKIPLFNEDSSRKGMVILGRDITERKRFEETLKLNEQKLSEILDAIPAGIIIIDWYTRRIININPTACQLLECEKDTSILKDCSSVICPGSPHCELFQTEESLHGVEVEFIRSDLSKLNLLKSLTVLDFAHQKLIVEAFTDITPLKVSEEKYRALYNNALIGLYKTQLKDGLVIECNNRFAQMLGFLNRDMCIHTQSYSRDRYVDLDSRYNLLEKLKEFQEVVFETQFKRQDGSLFWIRFTAKVDPTMNFLEGSAYDITLEKKMQDQLILNELKYRTIFEDSFNGIVLTDLLTLQNIDVNESALMFFGQDRETFLDRTIFDLITPTDISITRTLIRKLKINKELELDEARFIHSSHRYIYAELTCRIINYDNQDIICTIFKDITHVKELEIHFQNQKREVTEHLAREVASLQKDLAKLAETTNQNLAESERLIQGITIEGDG